MNILASATQRVLGTSVCLDEYVVRRRETASLEGGKITLPLLMRYRHKNPDDTYNTATLLYAGGNGKNLSTPCITDDGQVCRTITEAACTQRPSSQTGWVSWYVNVVYPDGMTKWVTLLSLRQLGFNNTMPDPCVTCHVSGSLFSSRVKRATRAQGDSNSPFMMVAELAVHVINSCASNVDRISVKGLPIDDYISLYISPSMADALVVKVAAVLWHVKESGGLELYLKNGRTLPTDCLLSMCFEYVESAGCYRSICTAITPQTIVTLDGIYTQGSVETDVSIVKDVALRVTKCLM